MVLRKQKREVSILGRLWSKIADYLRECDKLLLILCFVSGSFGCVAVLSATRSLGHHRDFFMQAFALLLGIAAAVIISSFDYRRIARFWPIIAAVTLIPVVLTFFIGYAPGNTDDKAWLMIAGISFQPSELLKIGFTLTFGLHLSRVSGEINKLKNVLLLCVHGLFPVALIFVQGDVGTAIIFAFMFIGMMFAAGLKIWYWVAAFGSAVVAAPLAYFFLLNDDHRERIANIFNIEADLLGAGWQQWRGRIALANGGFFGQGLFRGPLTQVKDGIPEGHNDFIFCSIGEELGMLGCLTVVLLLLGICLRILKISRNTNDRFGRFICVGVFSMFAGQIIINLGMCLSILPVIGVTLPLFSAGGTSLLFLFAGIGLVMSVHMHRSSLKLHLHDI